MVEMVARGLNEGKLERKYVGESGSEVGAGLASREEEEEGKENEDRGGVDTDRKIREGGRKLEGGSTDRKFVSWRERTSIGNSEWAGNFGVRPGIRGIGEEGIGRDGLRSWLREEGDRGCKLWADCGGREEGEGKFVDSGRSTQMGMGKNMRPADSTRKI